DVMTDDQWLAAIAKYDSGPFNVLPDGSVNSGFHGLAQELQRVARQNPGRFARLMERIPVDANPAYFDAIILAMANESVRAETALAVCRIGHGFEGRPFGASISSCIGKILLNGRSPESVTMVCTYIDPNFPDHVRSSAYSTLGNLLIADRERVELVV